jgi:signal peptidase I
VLSTAFLLVAAPLAIVILATWLAGWHFGIVRTGSMEPVLATGALIVASPITADDVEAGMIVEFVDPADRSRLITHRVVDVNRDPETGRTTFRTRGDANAAVDTQPVPPENIRSEVRWQVPGLGALIWKLRWPYTLLFLAIPLGLVGAAALVRRDAEDDSSAGAGERSVVGCISCPASLEARFRYCPYCGIRQRLATPPARRPVDHRSAPTRHPPSVRSGGDGRG